jgi:hypothetical protein
MYKVLSCLFRASEAVGDLAVLQAGLLELEGEILPGPRSFDELISGFSRDAPHRAR